MIHYVDTSAALKVLIDEEYSNAAAAHMQGAMDRRETLVSSWLLFTELHCAAGRRTEIPPASLNTLLDAVTLVDIERGDLITAGSAQWGLRSSDAIHLAAALRVEAGALITYDHELRSVAPLVGIRAVSPGE